MNTIHFNRIGLNAVSLNNVGGGMRKSAQGGSSEDVPNYLWDDGSDVLWDNGGQIVTNGN